MVGNFNVETVILPIDISISDAIMNFQESGFQISQKVFEVCGQPRVAMRRRKREAVSDNSPGGRDSVIPLGHAHHRFKQDYNTRRRGGRRSAKSEFEKIIVEVKRVVRKQRAKNL